MSKTYSGTDGIRSLLIPISTAWLLVPNAVVAEVLPDQVPDKPLGQGWLPGLFTWRNQTVPLLSLENYAHLALPTHTADTSPTLAEAQKERRIVVLYGLRPGLPFYALQAQSIPLSVTIKASDLVDGKPVKEKPALLATVMLGDKMLWLPDLPHLETRLLASGALLAV